MAQSGVLTINPQIRTIPNDYRLYNLLSKERKEFRIIKLVPGNEDDPLRCFLITESLVDGDDPSYEALSYCWGCLDSTETIELYHFCEQDGEESPHVKGLSPNATLKLPADGKLTADGELIEVPCYKQDFTVTTNVIAALRKLRNDTYYRTLWVDAICINQSDLAERVAQVAIMRLIYEQAKQTLIWLGEGNEACDFSMDAIYAIAAFIEERTGVDPMLFFGKSGLVFDPRLLDQLLLEFEQSQGWDDQSALKLSTIILGHFFAESWFRRVWVLQEVGTASRVVLRYGSRTVGWGAVLIVAHWQKRWIQKYLVFYGAIPNVEEIYRENTLPVAWQTITNKRALEEKIFLASAFGSTDPRDKLYALIGLASETWDLEDPSSTLRLQYDNSPEEAFANFTICIIQATSSLNILSAATKYSPTGARQLFPSGRSWIPEFDRDNTVQSLLITYAGLGHKGKPKCYIACNGLTVFPTIDVRNDILTLHGYTIDDIDFQSAVVCESKLGANDGYFNIIPFKRADGLFRSDSKLALSKILKHICTLSADYPPGGHSLEAFVSTLQLGLGGGGLMVRTVESEISNEKHITETLTVDDLMLDFLALCRVCELDMTGVADSYVRQESKTDDKSSSQRFLHMIHQPANGRCFFTTRTGLMGLCPVAARQGDCVVVLFGSPILFILRKMPSSDPKLSSLNISHGYEFIGECYVHGKMDGSVVRENMMAGRPPELFVLT